MSSNINDLTSDQISAACRRGFSAHLQIKIIRQLRGGTFNTAYLIEFADEQKIVLRVAPATTEAYWDDVALMRREYNVQPFFAAVASLLPRVLAADFTHQLIERDYMFQSYIEGERWEDVEDELTQEETLGLWRQFGSLVRRVHDTPGGHFGWPPPGRSFETWPELVTDRFTRIAGDLAANAIKATDFEETLNLVRRHASILNDVPESRLLHGDLWLFNLLIKRNANGPSIVGVLDADRAWWGDPLADWTMFLLAIREHEPEWQERLQAFQETYGPLIRNETERARQNLYTVMHLGTTAAWYARNQDSPGAARACRDLHEALQALASQLEGWPT